MQHGNKKIRNATSVKNKSIVFKSQLERDFYRILKEHGFHPEYEKKTIVLWEGFTPVTPFYDQETKKQWITRLKEEGVTEGRHPKILVEKTSKIIGIRYTPDFYFQTHGIDIWIEAKGIENDIFYIKKKMFRKYLDDLFAKTGRKSMYFEIYTKKQLLQALDIINNYVKSVT